MVLGILIWRTTPPGPHPQASQNGAAESQSEMWRSDKEQAVTAARAYFEFVDGATRNPQTGWTTAGRLEGASNVAADEEEWLLEGYVDEYRARNTKLVGEWGTEVIKTKPKGREFYIDLCRDPANVWTFDLDTQQKPPPADTPARVRLKVTPQPEGWRVTRYINLMRRSC
jgi:hypothetical protein